MNKLYSIKKIIIFEVLVLMLIQSVLLISFFAYLNQKNVKNTTRKMIYEQIDLTTKKLDVYRIRSQIDFITTTIFNLESVDEVYVFDKECNLIKREPVNRRFNWNCKDDLPNNIVVYSSESAISSSQMAPKFVVAKISIPNYGFLSQSANIFLFIIFLSLIHI